MKRICFPIVYLFFFSLLFSSCFGSRVDDLLDQLEKNADEITKIIESEDLNNIRTQVRIQKLGTTVIEIAEKIQIYEETMNEDQTVRFLEVIMKLGSIEEMNNFGF
jgi:hypothetical protein